MDVGMIHEILSPCVQDRDKSYLSTQIFGIPGEFAKSLCNRSKKDVVKDPFIPQGKRVEFCRYGKVHMEVWHWKEIFFLLLEPSLFLEKLAFGASSIVLSRFFLNFSDLLNFYLFFSIFIDFFYLS